MPLSRRALFSAGLAGLVSPRPEPSASPQGITPRPTPTAPPTAADWQALAAGLEGGLVLPGTASYDPTRQLFSPRFDGIRPPAIVRCAGPADVVEAVRFAVRTGLPIVPRGGGHSYVGASTTGTGIVLDVRPMKSVGFDAATRTATIGGGATLIDVYGGLAASGVSVPAGTCGSVGISGLTCGGGIGSAASAYGLTCDNVVAADVVTADGRYRTVDAEREPELFWGLRGGGGGRFGVVTSWRMRTHPAGTTTAYVLTYPWADAAARRRLAGTEHGGAGQQLVGVPVHLRYGGCAVGADRGLRPRRRRGRRGGRADPGDRPGAGHGEGRECTARAALAGSGGRRRAGHACDR
ncbi:FAD-binding oxidoreductase [Actinoplanes xinjiangensis]|uniref:FAD-binding oxidoreductase n=1 Tax=Actinoplanes xinjiangensis TaxID=512350 RepID=UPI000D6C1999|nr:FAD-binding oxidoreductase [Actinoplanes xinjiangensis]GIF37946.1 hypothetical protein Axi01nite_22570 [Actinoplanes xinjiangensis]